ncbi:Ig-like domain repeat protein [Nocardioides sp. Bht2]|uniref:Ig-like domain repeat protein n=1 Tax=Nocardioides sp. Bht2 TaxID=3392297 RepID=UPI0039B5AB7B
MSSRHSSTTSAQRARRVAGAGAAAALVVAGLGAYSPAGAASAPLNYECTTPLGAQTFVATFSAPATVPVGGSAALSTAVVVPEALAGQLYGLAGARTLSGTATGDGTASGVPVTVKQTIASTKVPASGAMNVVAKGGVAVPASVPVGAKLELAAGDFSVKLDGKRADGSGSLLTPYAISCVQVAGQDAAIGTVTVVKTGSKTKVTAQGGKKKATIKVVVKPGTKVSATGKVKVTLSKGKKKVTKTATLKSGKANLVVKRLKKGKYKVAAVYLGDKNVKGSKGSVKVTVK